MNVLPLVIIRLALLFTNLNNSKVGSNTWFLTEDGLYEVLMQSRKSIAKQFKDLERND